MTDCTMRSAAVECGGGNGDVDEKALGVARHGSIWSRWVVKGGGEACPAGYFRSLGDCTSVVQVERNLKWQPSPGCGEDARHTARSGEKAEGQC